MCGKNGRFELTNYPALSGLTDAFHPSSIVVRRCGSCRTRSRSVRRRWRRVKRTTNSLSSTSPTTTQGKIYLRIRPKTMVTLSYQYVWQVPRGHDGRIRAMSEERGAEVTDDKGHDVLDTQVSQHCRGSHVSFFYNKTTNSHNRSRLTVLGLSTRPTWM